MTKRRITHVVALGAAIGLIATGAQAFDWMAQKGQAITVALSAHPLADSLTSMEAEFEGLTGIDVTFEVLPENDYRTRLNTELAAKSDSIDVFMTGPSSNWEYAAGGWIADLQPFADNAELTSPDWDMADFYEGALNTNRWTGEEFAGVGSGPLYGVPMTQESYILYYRKDLLDAQGIAPPSTVDELIAAAEKLDGVEFEGKTIDGFVARGTESWAILITGYGSILFAHGASDLNPEGKSGAGSPETIAATEAWSRLMKTGPQDVASYDWPQALAHFGAGNAAFFLDADLFSAGLANPESSQVVGKVGYALPPEGPGGRASGVWLWALGMNEASDAKDAAWTFIQWASSKDTMQKSLANGVLNPTRKSVGDGPAMEQAAAGWPGYLDVWRQNSQIAKWRWNPSTRFSEAGNRWAQAVQQVYVGGEEATAAMAAAATDIDAIIDATRQ